MSPLWQPRPLHAVPRIGVSELRSIFTSGVRRQRSGTKKAYKCQYEDCPCAFAHQSSLLNHEVRKHGRPLKYKRAGQYDRLDMQGLLHGGVPVSYAVPPSASDFPSSASPRCPQSTPPADTTRYPMSLCDTTPPTSAGTFPVSPTSLMSSPDPAEASCSPVQAPAAVATAEEPSAFNRNFEEALVKLEDERQSLEGSCED